jgi:hypothetical protein
VWDSEAWCFGYWWSVDLTLNSKRLVDFSADEPGLSLWVCKRNWNNRVPFLSPGVVFIPGTSQLKAKDILYRLQMSGAKAIVTTDTLAPEVDSVASECPALKAKLLVSDHSHEGWLDFRSLIKWVSGLISQGFWMWNGGRRPPISNGGRKQPVWKAHQVRCQPCHCFVVWPWACTFPSLGLGVFFAKRRS